MSSPAPQEATYPGWAAGGGPRQRLADTGLWEEPFLLVGLRPHGLCQPGRWVVPQQSQAPEVVDKVGQGPFKELWFEESRCPVGCLRGPDPAGS